MDFRYVVHGQDNPLKRSVCTFTNHNDMLTYRRQMFEGLREVELPKCLFFGLVDTLWQFSLRCMCSAQIQYMYISVAKYFTNFDSSQFFVM